MIVVVGSYNVDFLIKVRDFPSEGETVFSDGVYIDHGGKGSNQAVSASRLGGSVRLISAVGNDEFGKRAIKFWEDERLDIAYVKIKNALTGSAYIVFDRKGRNFIVVNRGANALLNEEDLDGCLNGDILLTQLEVNENIVKKALKEFPGVKILNPAPAVLNDKSLLEYVDILTPNEIEFKELTGTQDFNYGIDLLLKKVKRAVIVTLGEKGAYIGTRERRILIPTLTVDAIDTTGAGDVFNASLAVYLEKGYSLERAVRISNIISAYSTTRIGALGPRLSEVSELIEKE
ncbi:ribokinase [Sulfolobus acidocaldarius SUSAZ]|nr:ribokinase [Sulfolobus acidocaldarius SUSAZ]